MWDTPIDILEKKNCFFCFCFSLCSVLLTSHKAMVSGKKVSIWSTTAFLAFGSPLLSFTNHSIMVFHLGPSPSIIPPSLCILAIETSLQNCSQQVRRTHSSRLPFKFKFYSTGWFLRRSSTSSGTKSQP